MKKILFFVVMTLILNICLAGHSTGQGYGVRYPEESLAVRIGRMSKDLDVAISFDQQIVGDIRVPALDARGGTEQILSQTLASTELIYKKISDRSYIIVRGESNRSQVPEKKITVSGKVRNEQGEPMYGVSVGLKNSISGTITDNEGKFMLTDIPVDGKLVFSFVGYQTFEQLENGKSVIQVVLKETSQSLDEVIVIGYGTAKKKDLTGAIASVEGTGISGRQNTQIVTALQGALPGVTVTRSSSAPGTGGTIRVRGITSMRDNGPLVIVDGIAVSSINDVNPNDIENLTVLKDAASASIYGARAAAGVILITTKRGTREDVNIDYNYSCSLDFPSRMPDYADAVTYMKIVNEREWNGAGSTSGVGEYSIYDQDLIDNYWTLHAGDPDSYPNTNWVDLILKDHATRQSHQVGITTFGEKSRSKISIGYDDVDGLFRENLSWNRITVRANNDFNLTKWLDASFDLSMKRTVSLNPAFSPSSQMRYAAPVYAAVYSDGRLAGGKDGTNPYGAMMYGGEINRRDYLLNGKAGMTVKPFEGFSVTGIFAPMFSFEKQKEFTKQVPYYTSVGEALPTGILDGTTNMDLTENRNDDYSYDTQLFINYAKDVEDHHINAMAGYEDYYYFNESLMASRDQYNLSYYPYLSAGPGDFKDNDGDAYENAYRSFFGRLMYNWKSKYYFQFNLRRDGSSRFKAGHRWGNFPSLSAGWIVSEENFMKEALPFISMLKLRGSWGQLGDERIGNYTYQSYLEFNNPTLYVGNAITSVQGASAYQYAIENNTWETTTTTDIGLDLLLAGSRFRFTGDYYRKRTKDMLIAVDIPDFMGFSDPYQNIGKMNTKGWDLELAWNDQIGGLRYGINLNLSDYKSMMGYLKGTRDDRTSDWTIIMEDTEYLSYYGYKSNGIYQNGDEVGAATSSVVGPGDIRYVDISGPDGVPDGVISAEYDRVPLGGSLPRYNYGGTVDMACKGFDFMLAFQGVGKKNAVLTTQMVQPVRGDWYNVPEIILGKYWSNYSTDEQNRQAKYPRISRDANANNYVASDFWMIDGSYFRIKNIMLGYTFPHQITERFLVKNLRLYTSLQDFFTISHFPKGWDPEVSSTGYPITKSVIFGASIKF